MKPIAVESTTLTTVAYDAVRELLQLGFRDQAVYHYFDVPSDVHEDLMSASSKGRSKRGSPASSRSGPPENRRPSTTPSIGASSNWLSKRREDVAKSSAGQVRMQPAKQST